MPHLPFTRPGREEPEDGNRRNELEVPGREQKAGKRASFMEALRSRLGRQGEVEKTGAKAWENESRGRDEQGNDRIEREKSQDSGRHDTGIARPDAVQYADQTWNDSSGTLLDVAPSSAERTNKGSAVRRRSASAPRKSKSPPPVPLPSLSAPTVPSQTLGEPWCDRSSSRPPNLLENGVPYANNDRANHDQQALDVDSSNCWIDHDAFQHSVEEHFDQAALKADYDRRWVLNLSMSFRDKSQQEKYFVTYAETPARWRRITISISFFNACQGSLEEDLKSMRHQRDKSFRIFEAIWESLADIQFYDTVTNLKLETTPQDGQLHVHVREDINEIIQYPATSLFDHIDYPHYREGELELVTHLSGFVYKVHLDDRLLIKKEIPGPDTVDEFLYEVNALDALSSSDHVVQLQGLITDESGSHVKGLLIAYASRGALVDILYDCAGTRDLPWQRKEKWARQIVAGLSDVHEAGFVQGDFTPSNIVIDDHDDAQIIDINRRGCPVGWEPPELGKLIDSGQRIGMQISVKTDLYQLGMVLWAIAEEVDEPDRQLPLHALGSDVPDWYCEIVKTCLSAKPQQRASAQSLLRRIPGKATRERPSVDFCISSITGGDVRASQSSVETAHRADKEYIDPELSITLDDIHRHNAKNAPFTANQVTYVNPREAPSNAGYRFESLGSWIVGRSRSRGRSLGSSRRRRSSPYGQTATSATSVSVSPTPGRRSARVYLDDADQGVEVLYPTRDGVKDLCTGTRAVEGSVGRDMPALLSPRVAEMREPFDPPLHQDSGFDEGMLQELQLDHAEPAPFDNVAIGISPGTSGFITAVSTPRASVASAVADLNRSADLSDPYALPVAATAPPMAFSPNVTPLEDASASRTIPLSCESSLSGDAMLNPSGLSADIQRSQRAITEPTTKALDMMDIRS